MVHTFIFCILSYSLYFYKFVTPTETIEFHIHQSYIKVELREAMKLKNVSFG